MCSSYQNVEASLTAHDFGTCKENAAARCRLPILKRAWPQDSCDLGPVQPHSSYTYRSNAQTCIRFSSTFWYWEHMANSYGKIKCQRSAFASRNSQAMAAGLPRQVHVWITTKQLVRFNKNQFDEIFCKLDTSKKAAGVCSFEQKPTLLLKVDLNHSKMKSMRC